MFLVLYIVFLEFTHQFLNKNDEGQNAKVKLYFGYILYNTSDSAANEGYVTITRAHGLYCESFFLPTLVNLP